LSLNFGDYLQAVKIFFPVFLFCSALFSNHLFAQNEVFSEFSNLIIPGYFFDGGFTYLLERNFQIDISSGIGILINNSFWLISSSFSLRIPRW
jgi:hypothetical protein